MSDKGRSAIVLLICLASALLLAPLAYLAAAAWDEDHALKTRIAALEASELAGPSDLQADYRSVVGSFLPILPPDSDFKCGTSQGIVVFDPANFEGWEKRLEPEKLNGVAVYPVIVAEDPETRETLFYNASEELIAVLDPEKGYNPFSWLELIHPEYYAINADPNDLAWAEALYDPARMSVTYYLLAIDDVPAMAEAQLAALEQAEFERNMMMGEELPEPVTNLVIFAIEPTTNGIALGIGWPEDFTNKLEVFARSRIAATGWAVISTNLSTSGTNSLWWVDATVTSNTATRFYRVGNADQDSDEDGLTDARERMMYGTDEASIDSDGDGLVDGYSGQIATNGYPGGAHTNGGIYVEGELTWGTDPNLFDTDGDDMGDGWEVANGHNPLDPNDPPNVAGTVYYDGRQTGTVFVVAVTASGSWATNHSKTLNTPGLYRIPNLPGTNYWLKAWVDSNGNGETNESEAWGAFTNNPVLITNQMTGQDIVLTDPDMDDDSLPDWWEIRHFGGITNWTGSDDPDADQYDNLDEYQADTDPTDDASHPWNIGGTIFYAGPQTGVIYVVACTNSGSWEAVQYTAMTSTGAYTITHLPPGQDYWIRAWRDSYGDATPAFWEAWGNNQDNPATLVTNLTAMDVTLVDADSDGDSLPDWWEVAYGLDPLTGGGASAAAWWTFDEGIGTNVQDATANANNGVLHNTVLNDWTDGVISNGVRFNGTNAYVQFQDSASLKPNFVSVSLWIKPSQDYTNGNAVFFSKSQPGGATGYRLSYENGSISFLICASGNKSVSMPCTLTNGVWHHVIGAYGGTTQRLYVDGVLCASTNYDWGLGFGYLDQGTTAPRIAASTDSTPSNCFAGVIDDARVYGRELASNEVHAIYELGSDADGDGLSAWQEYQKGTDPTDPDDPPNISGTVSYTGMQTGPINVLAATGATDWVGIRNVTLSKPGAYQLADLPPSVYWIKAYRDSDADGACDSWEASVLFSSNPLVVTGQITGVDIALVDPDLDGDGMPDWQEMAIVNASTNDAFESIDHVFEWADFDGDGVSNGDEIRLGTDPNNSNSVPPVLRFSARQITVSEAATNAVISITLLPAATGSVHVSLSVVGGTAHIDTDYAFTNQIVTFFATETNRIVNMPIMVAEPGEPDESVLLGLDALTGPAAMGPPNQMTIWISDSFADSDSDGLPDAWEIQFFGNLDQAGGGDPDGDGVNNLSEFKQGRHPLAGAVADTNNVLKLNVISPLR